MCFCQSVSVYQCVCQSVFLRSMSPDNLQLIDTNAGKTDERYNNSRGMQTLHLAEEDDVC